jgi:hypothetical protein
MLEPLLSRKISKLKVCSCRGAHTAVCFIHICGCSNMQCQEMQIVCQEMGVVGLNMPRTALQASKTPTASCSWTMSQAGLAPAKMEVRSVEHSTYCAGHV